MEKAIKEIRNKKATGDDDVSGDVLKLLGEDGLKIMIKLINTIYETGEWPKDFTEVTMIRRSHKLQNAATIANQPYCKHSEDSSKDRRRIEKKIECVLGEITLGLEEEKELGMQFGC
jgi:hypothetical protein